MQIQIQGLTSKQRAIMDVMWSIEDINKVNQFINSLSLRDRQDAQSLLEIAIMASNELDEPRDYHLAQEVIDKIK
jgi:hypothetical protein